MKQVLLSMLVLLCGTAAWSQDRVVTGKVVAADEQLPLPGVNVLVEGTTKGTTTDAEGNFSIQLAEGENTLVFSFVGYSPTTVQVGNQTTINVDLSPDVTALTEVVVVGYGTQREKDLTSSITTLKSDELLKTPSGQAMQSLQGKVPGVQIISAGAPGSSPTIRIRGVGSYPQTKDNVPLNNESPLYVVDGMFFDNIDFLNPADIATISILKDASAASIYGVRAANGVVLIETKSGKVGQKAQITYDGYYGFQVAQNVLQMANAEQFTNMALESGSAADAEFIQNAMERFGRSRVNPNVPDVNTDWYKEILRPAPIQNHNVSITGGGDKTSYSIGANYFAQGGILEMKNDYERFNLRTKLDYHANDWLTVGGNVLVSNATRYLQEDAAWNVAYFAVPIMPVYDPQNEAAFPTAYASAQTLGYRDGKNPFPLLDLNDNRQKIRKMMANFYARFELIPDRLSFQTTYNMASTFLDQREVELAYFLTPAAKVDNNSISKRNETFYNQIWDNVLTYTQSFNDHNLEVMAGTSFRDESWEMLRARGIGIAPQSKEAWYISQSDLANIPIDAVRDDGLRQYGMSYFGRIGYNFRDRYLLHATMRADGSSKYQKKWGYFPSVGLGWVLSEEAFLQDVDAISFLKLRAAWGRLGNDKVPASDGARVTNIVTTAIGDQMFTGNVTVSTFSWLRWELTEETNVGLTTRLLNDRLSIDADYFIRDTKDAAILVRKPVTGETSWQSVGEFRNSGLEVALNWSDNISDDLSYSIGVNIATLKNEVRDLYNQTYIDGGTAEFRQRTIIGEPILAFYGHEVAGVYQNDEEIQADPIAIANGLVPGDLKFKDQNNDGVLDADDRVVLGSYLPNFTYGANLGVRFRQFELSASLMGQRGNKILNRKRGEVIWTPDGNMDADLAKNRWHGEGTTNEYPSSAGLRKGWNQRMSDFFVEDGAFFRIQNVQLAYNLSGLNAFGRTLPNARISLTAERPLTVFKYNGFNPEVPNGVDTQTYPIPAIYTLGLNVKF